MTILGEEYKGLCYWRPMFVNIKDPDEAAINSIKKILEWEKKARIEEAKQK